MTPDEVISRNRRFKFAFGNSPVGFDRIASMRLSPASLYTHVMLYCNKCTPRCRGHRKEKDES